MQDYDVGLSEADLAEYAAWQAARDLNERQQEQEDAERWQIAPVSPSPWWGSGSPTPATE